MYFEGMSCEIDLDRNGPTLGPIISCTILLFTAVLRNWMFSVLEVIYVQFSMYSIAVIFIYYSHKYRTQQFAHFCTTASGNSSTNSSGLYTLLSVASCHSSTVVSTNLIQVGALHTEVWSFPSFYRLITFWPTLWEVLNCMVTACVKGLVLFHNLRIKLCTLLALLQEKLRYF